MSPGQLPLSRPERIFIGLTCFFCMVLFVGAGFAVGWTFLHGHW